MPHRGDPSASRFAATFPQRFAAALAEAQGTIAGIAASAESARGVLIDPESLRRLHEIYRLRVEIEIETAGVLWRTGEVVAALADVLASLSHRRRPVPAPPLAWLGSLTGTDVRARREGTVAAEGSRPSRWPEFGRRGQFPKAPLERRRDQLPSRWERRGERSEAA